MSSNKHVAAHHVMPVAINALMQDNRSIAHRPFLTWEHVVLAPDIRMRHRELKPLNQHVVVSELRSQRAFTKRP
jgi:hypothetical protein